MPQSFENHKQNKDKLDDSLASNDTTPTDAELLAAARHMMQLFARAGISACSTCNSSHTSCSFSSSSSSSPSSASTVASSLTQQVENKDESPQHAGADSKEITALDIFSSSQASAAVFSALLTTFAYEIQGSVDAKTILEGGFLGMFFKASCLYILVINLITTVFTAVVDFQSKLVIGLATIAKESQFDSDAFNWYMNFRWLRSTIWMLHISTVPFIFFVLSAASILTNGDLHLWNAITAVAFVAAGFFAIVLVVHLQSTFTQVLHKVPAPTVKKLSLSLASSKKSD
jgi:hypothetical protein